jgi:hypothetical protein
VEVLLKKEKKEKKTRANSTSTEVLPAEKAEVISSKYLVQYMFGAGTTGAIVPLINAVGVGWTFTICAYFQLSFMIFLVAKFLRYSCYHVHDWWWFNIPH